MKFERVLADKRGFIKISKDVYFMQEVVKTYYLARKKVYKMHDSWQNRNAVSRFIDIFLGDLAENVVKCYLKGQELSVTQYDMQVENGEKIFNVREEFDLMCGNNKIEIKSSCEKYSKNLENLMSKRRFILNKNNCHDRTSDYLVQVLYVPNDLDFFKTLEEKYNKETVEITSELLTTIINTIVLQSQIYICGFLTKEEQINFKKAQSKVISNENSNAKDREYADEAFLSKGHNIEDLKDYLAQDLLKIS